MRGKVEFLHGLNSLPKGKLILLVLGKSIMLFETKASFEPNIGNRGKSIENIVVQTTDGQRVPITITNVKSVGFKKAWWQFWKK